MTTHNFGTLADASHYVEIPDPSNAGQTKRPPAGVVLKVKNAATLADLPDITTTLYGYWAYTTTDVPFIIISGDSGATWTLPLQSSEAKVSSGTAGVSAAAALAATSALDTRVTAIEAGGTGGGGGPIAASSITDSTTVGRAVVTATDAAAARSAIGAGTSNVSIGTTAGTAKDGAYQPTAANISDAGTTGRAVLRAADTVAAKAALALDQANNTSDINKPISAATATALGGKQKTLKQYATQAAAAAGAAAGELVAGDLVIVLGP